MRGAKIIAVSLLLAFGCTTVRVNAVHPDELSDAPGNIAPPQIDFWLESSDSVSQRERDRAAAQVRQTIDSELQRLEIRPDATGGSDPVLFVRERGVGLTDARRSQQTLAVVGIVVGIVVVVAVLVAANSSGGGHHGSYSGAGHAAGGGASVHPIARPVGPIAASGPIIIHHPPHFYWVPPVWDVNIYIAPRPLIYVEEDEAEPFPPDAPPPLVQEQPETLAFIEPPPPPPPEEPPALRLPRLAPEVEFSLSDRGLFAVSKVGLQFDLVDRATGELLWSKAIVADEDPRDTGAMHKLVRRAFQGQRWASLTDARM